MNHLPWAALPDLTPGEAYGLSCSNATVSLKSRLARRLIENAKLDAGHLGLLVVGGVDYNRRDPAKKSSETTPPWFPEQVQSGQTVRLARRCSEFRLLGTGKEIEDVQAIFDDTQERSGVTIALTGSQAVGTSVKDSMSGMRYIHLATHGFFSPPELRNAFDFEDQLPAMRLPGRLTRAEVTTLYPGLLSGLMLAGVNNPPPCQGLPGRLDWGTGLITAEEVAGLDLSGCELAVLSACETGIGRVTGGEGVLGLQRAFHIAGARFVIASLWRIEDHATRRLMAQFYKNLWVHRLSPDEAMRHSRSC